MNVLHRVGDVCPEDHGGGAVVVTDGGYTMLEYTHGVEAEHPDTTCYGEDERAALPLPVFQVRLDEPAAEGLSWVSWTSVASFAGMLLDDMLVLAASARVEDIACVTGAAAGFYGWRALDPEPMTLSYADVEARWHITPKSETP